MPLSRRFLKDCSVYYFSIIYPFWHLLFSSLPLDFKISLVIISASYSFIFIAQYSFLALLVTFYFVPLSRRFLKDCSVYYFSIIYPFWHLLFSSLPPDFKISLVIIYASYSFIFIAQYSFLALLVTFYFVPLSRRFLKDCSVYYFSIIYPFWHLLFSSLPLDFKISLVIISASNSFIFIAQYSFLALLVTFYFVPLSRRFLKDCSVYYFSIIYPFWHLLFSSLPLDFKISLVIISASNSFIFIAQYSFLALLVTFYFVPLSRRFLKDSSVYYFSIIYPLWHLHFSSLPP